MMVAAFAMALMLAAPRAHAATQEFTILAVGVDRNSERAADIALDYARKRALYLAIRKLGVAEPDKAAARISPDQMGQIIRGATVLQSKRKAEKTYQEVKVTINELPLRQALSLKDPETPIGEVDASSMRNVLVLPALVTPKKTYVWDKENTLRAPLASELLRQAHGMLSLPSGDLADLRLIDGENVAKVKGDELKPMFERYGVSEIIIALYKAGTPGSEEPDKVILRRLNNFDPHDEALEIPVQVVTDTADIRTQHTAQAIASASVQIASATAQSMRQKLDAATKIKVKFIYAIPKEMGTMSDAIRHAPGVLLLEMPAINLNNVTGTIYLNGDKTALRKVLAAKGIICRDLGDQWTVSVR